MTRLAADLPIAPSASQATPTGRSTRRINPLELAAWLEERLPRVKERWLREVHHRYDPRPGGINGLLEEFLTLLASFLPGMLGPHRDQVEPLWIRASELFGAVAVRRGLAAGEVIEEFQILREAVIRVLYQDPPLKGRARISLREVLRLNRAIDAGVTHASVGHTDALFFALFQGSGIPDSPPTAELMGEIVAQLRALRDELNAVLGRKVRATSEEDAGG